MTHPFIERPWEGRCALTGLTVADYEERLSGVEVSDAIKRAAVDICRSYSIRGWSDPGYIANTINRALKEKP